MQDHNLEVNHFSDMMSMSFSDVKSLVVSISEEDEVRNIQSDLRKQKLSAALNGSENVSQSINLTPAHFAKAIMNNCDICRKDNYLYAFDPESKLMISLDDKVKSLISFVTTKYNEKSIFNVSQYDSLLSSTLKLIQSREKEFRNSQEAPTHKIMTRDNKLIDFKHKVEEDQSSALLKYDFFYKSPRALIDENLLNQDEKVKIIFFKKILEQVLNDWSNDKEDNLKFMKQIGYSVVCGFNCQKAIFLLGSGGNGKSTFIEMNIELVGKQFVVNVNLHQYGDSNAINKINATTRLLNGDDFSKKGTLGDSIISNFKTLTSGNTISVNKKYQDNVDISTSALLLQATNHEPEFFEQNEAIASRAIMMPWGSQSFRGKQTSLKQSDETFELSKLIKDDLFMDLYFTMIYDDVEHFTSFDVPEDAKRLTDEVLNDSDLMHQYIEEITDKFEGYGIIPNKVNFEYFRRWAKANAPHLLNMKINTFTKELKSRALKNNFEFISVQDRYNSRNYKKIHALCKVHELDKSQLTAKQFAIKFKNEISQSELESFNKSPDDELTMRDQQILDILIYAFDRTDLMSLFSMS